VIYMIENGFADPQREPAWTEWYSHHVSHSFRPVPGWRTGQRFQAIAPSFPKYRAMYTVESEDVMYSKEYKATTGGRFPADWLPFITDFHRNLFDGNGRAPAVPMDACLVIADPPATVAELPDVPIEWWKVVALDKSVPYRGVGVVSRAEGEEILRRRIPAVGVYRPIFEQYVQ
jgi:hypothetical protein